MTSSTRSVTRPNAATMRWGCDFLERGYNNGTRPVARLREQEKAALKGVVTEMLTRDPDLIINGDFNTTEQGIQELAQAIGMVVMVPAGQDGVGTTHANNRYDHFLVSPDLANEEAVSCRIQTFTGEDLEIAKRVSDHLPVLATFAMDERFRDRK